MTRPGVSPQTIKGNKCDSVVDISVLLPFCITAECMTSEACGFSNSSLNQSVAYFGNTKFLTVSTANKSGTVGMHAHKLQLTRTAALVLHNRLHGLRRML